MTSLKPMTFQEFKCKQENEGNLPPVREYIDRVLSFSFGDNYFPLTVKGMESIIETIKEQSQQYNNKHSHLPSFKPINNNDLEISIEEDNVTVDYWIKQTDDCYKVKMENYQSKLIEDYQLYLKKFHEELMSKSQHTNKVEAINQVFEKFNE